MDQKNKLSVPSGGPEIVLTAVYSESSFLMNPEYSAAVIRQAEERTLQARQETEQAIQATSQSKEGTKHRAIGTLAIALGFVMIWHNDKSMWAVAVIISVVFGTAVAAELLRLLRSLSSSRETRGVRVAKEDKPQ